MLLSATCYQDFQVGISVQGLDCNHQATHCVRPVIALVCGHMVLISVVQNSVCVLFKVSHCSDAVKDIILIILCYCIVLIDTPL